MINIPCRKCGSINIRKNGQTKSGAQKYHCRDCNFYGTLFVSEEKQKRKLKIEDVNNKRITNLQIQMLKIVLM